MPHGENKICGLRPLRELVTTSTPSPDAWCARRLISRCSRMFLASPMSSGSLFFVVGKSTVVFYLTLSLGPRQPRLDSGSLPAGWFPLPDAAARGLLGCHPFVPCSLSSMSLEELWVTSTVRKQHAYCRGRFRIVTSTVRKKQMREVCTTKMKYVTIRMRFPATFPSTKNTCSQPAAPRSMTMV